MAETALVAAGQATAAGVSPAVAALTEGLVKGLLLGKLKATLTAAVLILSMVGFGTGLHLYQTALAQQASSEQLTSIRADHDTTPTTQAAKKDVEAVHGIRPGDRLQIDVLDTRPNRPIKGPRRVEPEGTVNLGAPYGRVQLKGKTMEQAEAAIKAHLGKTLRDVQVSVSRYDPPVEERYLMLERQVQQLQDERRALRATVEQLQKPKGR